MDIKANTRPDAETQVTMRQALIRTMLQHGTLDDPEMTVGSLAATIGLPDEQLVAYLKGSAPRWVDSLIARYLSVPIRHWIPGVKETVAV